MPHLKKHVLSDKEVKRLQEGIDSEKRKRQENPIDWSANAADLDGWSFILSRRLTG